ncbi:MAG TPA: hypothetical protein VNT01_03215, partial [Symbiobacteriaceae bacterium]|nr:hypothetical protein [Symbiobacteriaceae bacterium]
MKENQLAAFVVVLGLALLAWSFVPGYGPQETEFEGTTLTLKQNPDTPITEVAIQLQGRADTPNKLRAMQPADPTNGVPTEVTYSLRGLKPAWYSVNVTTTAKEQSTLDTVVLQVLDREYGFMAALGALLVVLAAPTAVIRSTRLTARVGKRDVPLTGWTYLLMEPTGLSLARLQLVLLFVPAAVAYLALAFPLHYFPDMPASIWQLLGISGATAALSTLINPKGQQTTLVSDLPLPASYADQAAALQIPAAEAVLQQPANPDTLAPVYVQAPSLSDLFDDGSGYGDISRYQSLVMCGATAAVFIVSFFDTWTVPDIPDQILQLLGMSLAVYLGVKG